MSEDYLEFLIHSKTIVVTRYTFNNKNDYLQF